ncbi:uncharacterized protein LOC144446830 [Glandiceps talaboti]
MAIAGSDGVSNADCVIVDISNNNGLWLDKLKDLPLSHLLSSDCPIGWTRHSNSNCYKLSTSTADWLTASGSCRAETGGADLAAISDQELQNFAVNNFLNPTRVSAWIGVHDRNTENQFEYMNGEKATYFPWQSQQPDDDDVNEDQDCVAAIQTNGGLWEDKNCDISYKYICERSLLFTGVDVTSPVISSCPNDIPHTTDNGRATTTVSWTPPTATDESGPVTMTTTHAPDDIFSIGQTIVEYRFTDVYANEATCTFTITVTDDEPPNISNCPADVMVNVYVDQPHSTVEWTPPSATDNSGEIITPVVSHQPGDTFPVGMETVTYQFTDSSLNTASCYFTVSVQASIFSTLTVPVTSPIPGSNGIGCERGQLCDLSDMTVEEVEELSTNNHLTSTLLLAISQWMKSHDVIAEEINNKTAYTWYYLKLCGNILQPSNEDNWKTLSQISTDGPADMMVICEKVANNFADVATDFPVDMNFPTIDSHFERLNTSNLRGYNLTFPVTGSDDDTVNFIAIDDSLDVQSFNAGDSDEATVVAILFRYGSIFRERNVWEVRPCSPVLSFCAHINGDMVSLPVKFGLKTIKNEDDHQNDEDGNDMDNTDRQDMSTMQYPTHCAFWRTRQMNSDEEGFWSNHGCVVTMATDDFTQCHCNHTTSFAILVQFTEVKMTREHERSLSIITYVGCAVSLAALTITLSILLCLTSLRSERTAIHKNLVVALLFAQILFLSGINATSNKIACKVISLLLHYFFMAVFCWMMVEGIHLYGKVVQVFNTGEDKIKYYLSVGWGVPVIVVAVAAAINWEGYGSQTSCWLTIEDQMVWAFVGPAALIIVINLIILAMVLRIVVTSAAANKEKEFDHIKAGVKGALVLIPILGLSWMFGLLAVNDNLLAFHYLFAICNSLQGFFIFLFQCILNGEVRAALRRVREKRALERGGYISSTSGAAMNTPVSVVSIGKKTLTPNTRKLQKNRNSIETMTTDIDTYVSRDSVIGPADTDSIGKISQISGRTTASPNGVRFTDEQSLLSLNTPDYTDVSSRKQCEIISLTETERKTIKDI